ncbi:MAG: DUF2249 domain-containing protein [Halobacteriaceae archaeon]
MSPTDDAVHRLDVRDLDREPFGPITEALADLPEGDRLVLVNRFEPEPLYDVLERRGFAYETTQAGPEEWRVEITHA